MNKSHHLGSDFTTNALAIIDQLEERATGRSLNLGNFLPELLIWTTLRWEKNVGVAALEVMGVNCWELEQRLDSFLKSKASYHSVPNPIPVVRDWARHEALLMGSNYKGTEHLLLGAISAAGPELRSLLTEQQVEYEKVRRAIVHILDPDSGVPPGVAPQAQG
jgi:ATP-dependent Clp protease ATP-binding subunit ClpC